MNSNSRSRVFFFLSFIHLFSHGCTEQNPVPTNPGSSYDGEITVVTTTTQITDIVSQIAGIFARLFLSWEQVSTLTFTNLRSRHGSLSFHDLVIFHGLKFEGKLSTALKNARESKVRTYEACSVIPANKLLSVEEEDGIHLIRMFGSILNFGLHVPRIATQMASLIPHEKKLFEERSQKLQSRYKKIGDWAKKNSHKFPHGKGD